MIEQCTKGYITTISGRRVYFLDPKPHQIRIEDIAWHLANTCRFNGHMKSWYSNAEHLINCAYMSKDLPLTRRLFIHDFAEFVFGDMTTPIKRLFPEYKKVVDNFQSWLDRLFCGDDSDMPELKVIDQRMTATEFVNLRIHIPEDITADPYVVPRDFPGFRCLERQEAFYMFMTKFDLYFPEYRDAV